jgi:hypothetical protein
MDTAVRLGGYAAALAVAFGAAWAVGAAVGPAPAPAAATPATQPDNVGASPSGMSGMDMGGMPGMDHSAGSDGLSTSSSGYTLVPRNTTFVPGRPGELAFTVTDSDGRPATLDPGMRVAVVRRDAAGFQRPQPVLGPDGVWRAPLVLPAGGVWRLFADVAPRGGPELVLGVDLFAQGDFTPVTFTPSRVAQVDGYQVRLDGDLAAGQVSQVFATVSRDGRAVTDLEPLGGGFGDLTVLRRSDLADVSTGAGEGPAPAPADRSGPGIAFTTNVPTSGSYRAFIAFRHAGTVHIAEFTLTTREG